MWQGPAFGRLDTPWLNGVRDDLHRRRLAVELDRNDLALRRGRHASLLSGLLENAAQHPLDERLAGQLMLTLYRCGRQADALAQYQQLRLRLAEDLGVDPSPQIQQLYQQILEADPGLAAAQAGVAAPHHLPQQLPADVHAFSGRRTELAVLDHLLRSSRESARPGPVVISVVSGTAGVGKTALAVHWAHRVADQFPDGQLYVNLRGYDPEESVDAAEALGGFLHALGVAPTAVPATLEERGARYRSALAGRRVLVVLDNTGDAEQVRPLLPGSATCFVLVTSRDSLAGLIALHGARRVDLDLLPVEDALALLDRLVGHRVRTEPHAAALLAAQCARLPLALRVAAELAASRPDDSLDDLVDELRDSQRRLDVLGSAAGDPRADVQAVFSWSYSHLPADASLAFRFLGLHAGPDFDAYSAAALLDAAVPEVQRLLAALTRAHLIQPVGTGRHSMHDLLRAYAKSLMLEHDTEPDWQAAANRLAQYYLDAVAVATETLHPVPHRPRRPPRAMTIPPLDDPTAARRWLNAEQVNLVSTGAHAATKGWGGCAIGRSLMLSRILAASDVGIDAIAFRDRVIRAAQESGDAWTEAHLHWSLGLMFGHQGYYDIANEQHREAERMFLALGDVAGLALAGYGLGLAHAHEGRYEEATGALRRAAAMFSTAGYRRGHAHALHGLGFVQSLLGQHEPAVRQLREALAIARLAGDDTAAGYIHHALGLVSQQLDSNEESAASYEEALRLFESAHDWSAIPLAMLGLGVTAWRRGEPRIAVELFADALAMYRQSGNRAGEAEALNRLGETALAGGSPEEAVLHHQHALTLATRICYPYEKARAHDGLATTYDQESGNSAFAHRQQAALLFKKMGIPEEAAIRARLERGLGKI